MTEDKDRCPECGALMTVDIQGWWAARRKKRPKCPICGHVWGDRLKSAEERNIGRKYGRKVA